MNTAEKDTCPLCNADLTGDPIPQEYLDAGYYTPGVTHYSRQIGHEIRGVYDGVLYWACPDCGGAWRRWLEGRLGAEASRHVALHNGAGIR